MDGTLYIKIMLMLKNIIHFPWSIFNERVYENVLLSLFQFSLFCLTERLRDRTKEIPHSLIHLPDTCRLEQGGHRSWKLGTQSGDPTWGAGIQWLELALPCPRNCTSRHLQSGVRGSITNPGAPTDNTDALLSISTTKPNNHPEIISPSKNSYIQPWNINL